MQTKSLKNILNKICTNLRNLPAVCLAGLPAVFLEGSRTISQKTIRANSRHSRTFFFLFLFAVSCSKSPTDSRTGTLTGTVLLEGQQDHSGTTVALYQLAELDTTILRYNREYPNVGFPIFQATEFACPPSFWRNHRLGEVAAEAKTKQDGCFEIAGVEEGTYNLVAEKTGFGWKYIYNVIIKNGTNTSLPQILADRTTQLPGADRMQFIINNAKSKIVNNSSLMPFSFDLASLTLNLGLCTSNYALKTLNFGLCTSNNSITLYPETQVNGTITENTTWQRNRHFIVTEDITVPQNTSLTIEPGAVVRFDSYYKLKIEGNLICQGEADNMVMFTSNQDQQAPGDWCRLELEGVDSTSTIEYTRISFAANGILCKRASPRIARTCVRQSAEVGILIANESAPTIEHNLVFNASTGIRVEGGSQPKLSYNIIANEDKETLFGTGVVTNASSAKIEDNIILHFDKGLIAEYGGAPCVEYNLIVNCETGINIGRCSGLDLNHNIVQYCRSIGINLMYSYPRIYNNNIVGKDQAIYLLATGGENPKPHDLIVSNNYWGNTALEEIGRRIIDERADNNGQKGEWRVIYEPIALEPFTDAGPH